VINHGTVIVQVNDVKSYPNPFDPWKNEVATISFDLTKAADVTIKILDFAGSPVKTVYTGWLEPGLYDGKYFWDGSDESGKTVASGAYIGFIKIDDGSKVITKDLKIGVVKRCD
jgi:flagellar hook assembly protein FlgD